MHALPPSALASPYKHTRLQHRRISTPGYRQVKPNAFPRLRSAAGRWTAIQPGQGLGGFNHCSWRRYAGLGIVTGRTWRAARIWLNHGAIPPWNLAPAKRSCLIGSFHDTVNRRMTLAKRPFRENRRAHRPGGRPALGSVAIVLHVPGSELGTTDGSPH